MLDVSMSLLCKNNGFLSIWSQNEMFHFQRQKQFFTPFFIIYIKLLCFFLLMIQ